MFVSLAWTSSAASGLDELGHCLDIWLMGSQPDGFVNRRFANRNGWLRRPLSMGLMHVCEAAHEPGSALERTKQAEGPACPATAFPPNGGVVESSQRPNLV